MPQKKTCPNTPTLKQIGFEIPGIHERTPAGALGWRSRWHARLAAFWKIADPVSRHPLMLLLVASLFSVGVGGWLTSIYQERQREREATVRSMDELRSVIDDVSLAFNQYESAASRLMTLKEAGSSPDQVTRAQTAYDQANEKWQLKSFAEIPDIRQRMPGYRGGDGTVLILSEIQTAAIVLDACLTKGSVISGPGKGAIKCTLNVKGHPELTAEERLGRLMGCNTMFHLLIRPNPKNDFDSEAETQTKLGSAMEQVQKSCSFPALLG